MMFQKIWNWIVNSYIFSWKVLHEGNRKEEHNGIIKRNYCSLTTEDNITFYFLKYGEMVRAWYMDNDANDQREEHHRNPHKFISLNELYTISGVEYFKLNIDDTDGILEELKKKRGYTYEDEIICSEKCLPNYEEKIKSFFLEHLHTDEEIRFVVEGSGYFDVRDKNDEWVRIEVVPGDLIIIPSGIYHRFTLDMKNYIRAKRFFIGEPIWTPYNRPVDDMDSRKEYIQKLQKGEFNNFQ